MAGEQHLYLVASGQYVSGNTALAGEIWQTGIRLIAAPGAQPDPIGELGADWTVTATNIDRDETGWTISGNWYLEGGVTDLDPGDYLNDQAAPAWAAFMIAADSFISSQVALTELRLYPIVGPSGHVEPAPPYLQGSPCVLTFKTPQTGGQGGVMLPPQTSVVASLRTNQIGRKGRGRMYLPPMGNGVMTTGAENGTIASTNRAKIAGAVVDLLEALELDGAEPSSQWVTPIVTGAPYNRYAVVSQVRVGNVFDTQQRRRRSIAETYSTKSVTVWP